MYLPPTYLKNFFGYTFTRTLYETLAAGVYFYCDVNLIGVFNKLPANILMLV